MSMFCHQCQEAAGNVGCKGKIGVCGKTSTVSNLQDLLVYVLKGVSEFNLQARTVGLNRPETDRLMLDSLFSTITNANFDGEAISDRIEKALLERDTIKSILYKEGKLAEKNYPDSAIWTGQRDSFIEKSEQLEVSILGTEIGRAHV